MLLRPGYSSLRDRLGNPEIDFLNVAQYTYLSSILQGYANTHCGIPDLVWAIPAILSFAYGHMKCTCYTGDVSHSFTTQTGGEPIEISRLARDLMIELSELDVIDAHEHLPPESEYLSHQYSGANMFAAGYIGYDLESAGLEPGFRDTLREGGYQSIDSWWPKIRPFWEAVRYSSFARALTISVRDLYDIHEISDETIPILAECVMHDNRPGLYKRILYDRCRIHRVITCIEHLDLASEPRFVGLSIRLGEILRKPLDREAIKRISEESGFRIKSLDGLSFAVAALLKEDIERGAVGFKIAIAEYRAPHPQRAEEEFRDCLQSSSSEHPRRSLRDHLLDKGLDVAAELGVPVAVHAGFWGDFRQYDPKFMLDFALRRSDVCFDLFHLGMPMIRDAIQIGKNLRNVSLNLTWCPIISQVQTSRALDEIIDLVPINKVIAFGGDYRVSVQETWGHLTMARECVAEALSHRITSGQMSKQDAFDIARLWFYENPKRIYRLHCPTI